MHALNLRKDKTDRAALILAIESDRKQASRLATIAKDPLNAELLVGHSTEEAFTQLGSRRPDLILTSLLLSPKDESALADRLRELDSRGWRVQTLVIPVLGGKSRQSKSVGGLLTRLRGGKTSTGKTSTGCDPAVFAAQIQEYLERAVVDREAALEDEAFAVARQPVFTPEPVAEASETQFESFEAAYAPEPEPAYTPEPEYTPEPAYAAEPEYAPEPADTPEPVYVPEPAYTTEAAFTPELVHLKVEPTFEPEPAYEPEPADIPAPAFTPEPVPEPVYVPEPVLVAKPAYEPSDLLPEIDFELPEVEIISEPSPADDESLDLPESTPDRAAESAWESLSFDDPVIEAATPIAAADSFDASASSENIEADVIIEGEPIDLAKFLAELSVAEPVALKVAQPAAFKPVTFVPTPMAAAVTTVDQPQRLAFLDQPPTALRVRWAWPQLEGAAFDEDLAAFVSDEPADEVAAALAAAVATVGDAPAPVKTAHDDKKNHSKKSGNDSRKKKKAALPPPQDEWGFFDPNQCGFAALVAKLDEIAKDDATNGRK